MENIIKVYVDKFGEFKDENEKEIFKRRFKKFLRSKTLSDLENAAENCARKMVDVSELENYDIPNVEKLCQEALSKMQNEKLINQDDIYDNGKYISSDPQDQDWLLCSLLSRREFVKWSDPLDSPKVKVKQEILNYEKILNNLPLQEVLNAISIKVHEDMSLDSLRERCLQDRKDLKSILQERIDREKLERFKMFIVTRPLTELIRLAIKQINEKTEEIFMLEYYLYNAWLCDEYDNEQKTNEEDEDEISSYWDTIDTSILNEGIKWEVEDPKEKLYLDCIWGINEKANNQMNDENFIILSAYKKEMVFFKQQLNELSFGDILNYLSEILIQAPEEYLLAFARLHVKDHLSEIIKDRRNKLEATVYSKKGQI